MKDYSAITEALQWLNHALGYEVDCQDISAAQQVIVEAKLEHQFLLDKIAKLQRDAEWAKF